MNSDVRSLPGEGAACVYTALLGGYEQLVEQPVAASSHVDFVCFTDDERITSETWTIRHVEPVFVHDASRSQRALKIRAHAAVPEYDVSLYVDNSVLLKVPPERLIEALLPPEADFAAMAHSYHDTVADEFRVVAGRGLDSASRLAEQEHHYRLSDPESLASRPVKSCLLLRRHHAPRVVAAMESWFRHVLRYSRRDQLSVRYCLREAGLEPLLHDLDNFESAYHRWPVTVDRRQVDEPWRDAHDDLAVARRRADVLHAELRAIHASRSWRWTGLARRIRRASRTGS
jgi:hypothetical protein